MTQSKKDLLLISGLAKKDIYRQFRSLDRRQQAEFINSLVLRNSTYIAGRHDNKFRYHLPVNGKRIRTTRQTMLETLKIDVQTLKSLQESLQTQSSEVSSTMKNIKKHHEADRTLNKFSAKNNVPVVALSPRVKLQKMPDCLFNQTMNGIFATPKAPKERPKMYETPKRVLRSPAPPSIPYYISQCDNYPVYETPKKKRWIRTDPETNAVLKLSVDSWTQTKPSVVIHPTEKKKSFVDQAVQTEKAKLGRQQKLNFDFREETMTSINVKRILAHPLVFIGLPTISWLDRFSNHYNFIPSNVLLVLYKIRHNDIPAKLAFDFDKSEREVLQILHDNVPLMYTVLSSIVNWDGLDDENEDEGIPPDLKVTFANLKSILKVIHVRVGENYQPYKFFISILPSGRVSFVSEAVEAKESNEKMFRKSNFVREAPTNCAIIMDEELQDVEEMLKERDFTVYVKRQLEQDDFSCNVFLQRDIAIFCNKVKLTLARFAKFQVMERFMISEFEDIKGLQLVATIAAAMVNLHFCNDRNLQLQIGD